MLTVIYCIMFIAAKWPESRIKEKSLARNEAKQSPRELSISSTKVVSLKTSTKVKKCVRTDSVYLSVQVRRGRCAVPKESTVL